MRARAFLAFVTLAALLGCAAEGPPAIDFELVPDRALNTEADVLEAIDRIVLVVDSPDGLYPPGSERDDGTIAIVDVDGDPSDLELVALVPIPAGRLPRVRLEEGGLPAVTLDVRVLGLPPGGTLATPTAEGRLRGLSFLARRFDLPLPFNLRPELLPPRVVEVIARPPGACGIPLLIVVFSKAIAPATLLAPSAIVFEPGGAPSQVLVDAAGRYAQIVPPDAVMTDARVRFSLTIATSVTDGAGRPLDQIATKPGDQPYVGLFDVSCTNAGLPGATPADAGCGGDPGAICPDPSRFECVEGLCVPTSCEGAICLEGHVCDPATSLCAVDCRAYGDADACPAERPSCDANGHCVLPP